MRGQKPNLLWQGDALDVGDHVPRCCAELAYLDPPFCVGTVFRARERSGGARAQGPAAYRDRWPSLESYIVWLEPRLDAVRACLSPQGTLWLHLDHRAVHDAKVACDRVFGRASFLGEVIWAPGNGARGLRRGPPITHQTLLVYAAGADPTWNAHDPDLREPFAKTSLTMHFQRRDNAGRQYRERVIRGKTYRYYADRGRARGSVWMDCPSMVANTPLRTETTGYPTQKPRKLLERIVRASSTEGALVVDPFCGSGTTLVAAAATGRRFAGCDVGERAIRETAQRLTGEGIAFDDPAVAAPSPPLPPC